MLRAEKPDCRTCGACCVALSDQEAFCDITDEDKARLSARFVAKHVLFIPPMDYLASVALGYEPSMEAIRTKWTEIRTGPLAGCELNTCAALNGSVMSRVSCMIYPNRPRVCRHAVRPGDRSCRDVRRLFTRLLETKGVINATGGGR
jgi:Fe-S-cluster containining protein